MVTDTTEPTPPSTALDMLSGMVPSVPETTEAPTPTETPQETPQEVPAETPPEPEAPPFTPEQMQKEMEALKAAVDEERLAKEAIQQDQAKTLQQNQDYARRDREIQQETAVTQAKATAQAEVDGLRSEIRAQGYDDAQFNRVFDTLSQAKEREAYVYNMANRFADQITERAIKAAELAGTSGVSVRQLMQYQNIDEMESAAKANSSQSAEMNELKTQIQQLKDNAVPVQEFASANGNPVTLTNDREWYLREWGRGHAPATPENIKRAETIKAQLEAPQ